MEKTFRAVKASAIGLLLLIGTRATGRGGIRRAPIAIDSRPAIPFPYLYNMRNALETVERQS